MKYVIIGNGAAGVTAAENIRRFDASGDISVISDETFLPYCRPMISHLLEGSVVPEKLPIRDKDFYEKNRITPVLGTRVFSLDPDRSVVATKDGKAHPYDRLLIACGADPRSIDADGADLENIFFMRNVEQVKQMLNILPRVENALVLGGGLVGFKAACSLLRRGVSVTMLIRSEYPLSMQVDETAGHMIRNV
ncbi:MAG: FAD-dependent oxidoreductase, partial [Desulfobacteraceae bacterium]|nr:FAD-dependent oxidoreductase [Desulfobacteraceae bacterium]